MEFSTLGSVAIVGGVLLVTVLVLPWLAAAMVRLTSRVWHQEKWEQLRRLGIGKDKDELEG